MDEIEGTEEIHSPSHYALKNLSQQITQLKADLAKADKNVVRIEELDYALKVGWVLQLTFAKARRELENQKDAIANEALDY